MSSSIASGAILTGTANLTYYSSYPSCCDGVPDYDGKKYTDTTECTEYSGCDYQGQFAAYRDLTFEEVQQMRIVAFFKTGSTNFYAGKRIRLTKGTKTIDAVIGDTCGDADCGGCCTENAGSLGYLVDLEYFTAVAFLGSTDYVDGTVAFSIFST
ncbi:hypothetical protein JKP88DRAFT_302673 [Tribonema minus]|uniref:Uncharacterized protein n=1 Tax=Tribonema minus TaxID=303371 RepID=A0A836CKS2_9STRA|nr:hypothetical protein JKP88DRAFT_302673 [Tribonema minus]